MSREGPGSAIVVGLPADDELTTASVLSEGDVAALKGEYVQYCPLLKGGFVRGGLNPEEPHGNTKRGRRRNDTRGASLRAIHIPSILLWRIHSGDFRAGHEAACKPPF